MCLAMVMNAGDSDSQPNEGPSSSVVDPACLFTNNATVTDFYFTQALTATSFNFLNISVAVAVAFTAFLFSHCFQRFDKEIP